MLKNATNKMKNAIESFNKLNQAKERICKLEDSSADTIQSERKEFRIKKCKEIYTMRHHQTKQYMLMRISEG